MGAGCAGVPLALPLLGVPVVTAPPLLLRLLPVTCGAGVVPGVGAAPTPPKPMPAGLRDEARQAFSDTYAFAKREFGSRVPAKWFV